MCINVFQILLVSNRIGNPLRFDGTPSEIAARYKIVTENKQNYADAHLNIDFVENYQSEAPPMFSKVYTIRDILMNVSNSKYDYIVWMDADAAFLNCNILFSDLIQNDVIYPYGQESKECPDLIVNLDDNGINDGVFALRNNDWSLDFAQNWSYPIETGMADFWSQSAYRHDQSILAAILMGMDVYNCTEQEMISYAQRSWPWYYWTTEQAFAAIHPNFREHVGIMPRYKWNLYLTDDGCCEFIVHCAGNNDCKKNLDKIIQKRSNCDCFVTSLSSFFETISLYLLYFVGCVLSIIVVT